MKVNVLPWKWTEIILSHKGAKTSNKFPFPPPEGCPNWSLKGVRAGADFTGWPTLGGAMCLSHAHYPAFAPHTSEVATGFFTFLYLIHNLLQLHMYTVIFSPL